MEASVFQFVKPMQLIFVKSKCSCVAYPKPIHEQTNTHITLTKVFQKLIDFIPAFVTVREPACRTDLGIIEPLDNPANYSIDDKFPVLDLESNTTIVEKYYICEAPSIVDITRFIYTAPFVVVDTGKDPSLMTDLPDPLYIGEYTYHLSAGINNTNEHFTGIVKSHNNTFYRFDDTHRLGLLLHETPGFDRRPPLKAPPCDTELNSASITTN
ncbi:hypothetical protein I4U23_000117 [Adineta vaga]|nr:hypothetical protein I4U23_000117 [Adineta vaga]